MSALREKILMNLKGHSGPVIATGMSEYEPGADRSVSEVFDRADDLMYADKRRLKDHNDHSSL